MMPLRDSPLTTRFIPRLRATRRVAAARMAGKRVGVHHCDADSPAQWRMKIGPGETRWPFR